MTKSMLHEMRGTGENVSIESVEKDNQEGVEGELTEPSVVLTYSASSIELAIHNVFTCKVTARHTGGDAVIAWLKIPLSHNIRYRG